MATVQTIPTVETNGIETYYERHGDGHPIVCAPGGGWDHRSWYPQVEALGNEFELILYDPRGHGKTEYAGSDQISVDLLAADMGALIGSLELEQPAIMGCSLGGLIAHAYAAANPSDVGALILLEAPRGMTDVPLLMRIMQRIQETGSRFIGAERLYTIQQWVNSLVGKDDQWADQPLPGLDMEKGEYVDDVASRIDEDVMMRMSSILQYEATNLDSIAVPTLVLTGADSSEFFEDEADVLAERILDAGHGAHMDNPDAFNETVRDFLDGVLDERQRTAANPPVEGE